MNLYTTLPDQKDWLGITASTYDSRLMGLLEDASRFIDDETKRYFFTRIATLYVDTDEDDILLLPEDLITVTTLTTDSEADGTYDGETWTENTDFWTHPYESYPKTSVRLTDFGTYAFSDKTLRNVKIVGIWGYGNRTSDPWEVTTVTGTLSSTTDTRLALSADGVVETGHTLKLDDEQVFVTAYDDTSGAVIATVERAVNGTTAAAHAAKTVSIAQYPRQITQACRVLTTNAYRKAGDEEMAAETIGDYSYRRASFENTLRRERRLVEFFRKVL